MVTLADANTKNVAPPSRAHMANFDKQFILLTTELKEIITDELKINISGGESVFLKRQAGVPEFMHRSSRSREIQHVESLINRMEIILDKTGMFRDECILQVLDQYRELLAVPEKDQRMLKRKDPNYIEKQLLEQLKQF